MKVIAVLCLLVASVAAGSYGNFEEIRSAPLRHVESYAAPIRHVETYEAPVRVVVEERESYSAPFLVKEELGVPETKISYSTFETPDVKEIIEETYPQPPLRVLEKSYVPAPVPVRIETYRPAPIRHVESYAAPIRHVESYAAPAPVRHLESVVVDSHQTVTPVREIVESYSGSPVRELITEHSYAAPLPVRELSYGHEERFMSSPIRQLSYGHEERLIAAPVRALHHEKFISRPMSRLVSGPSGQTRFDHLIKPESGAYDVNFETYNGIVSHESGSDSNGALKAGETSWTSPEGKHFTLKYTADENGYKPTMTEDGRPLEL